MKKFNTRIIHFFIFLIFSFLFCEFVFSRCPKVFSKFFSYIAVFSNKLKFGFGEKSVSCFKELKEKDLEIKNMYSKNSGIYCSGNNYKFTDVFEEKYFKNENYLYCNNLFDVKNLAAVSDEVIVSASKKTPYFNLEETEKPQVLIYHTHTTESYGKYNENFNLHSKNPDNNVVAVGEEIENILKENYINTIHDFKIHDSPSYMGSYFRSALNIKNNIKKYTTIKVILDIHRGYKSSMEEKIYRKKDIAKINIVVGCSNRNVNFEKNLAFAFCLQKQLKEDIPDIAGDIELKDKNYNQDFLPGALLIKIGSYENSLREAKFSAKLFAISLAKLLNSLKIYKKEVINNDWKL